MKKVFLSLLTFFMVLSLSVVLVKASEATTVELVDGVQIRTDGNNGLRWQANVTNAAENQTYGFLFAQGEVKDLTVETAGVVNKEITELNENGNFAASMTKFPKAAVANDISVRAYVKTGNEYTYSENIVVRNLAEVALGAKNKAVEGEFVESVVEYIAANYKKTYVDANGNVFVNSAVYETVPANLEKLFVADWNAAFETAFEEFDAANWKASAVDGTNPLTDASATDCTGTNAYEFFVANEVTSAKWAWVLDLLSDLASDAVKPVQQINALKDAEGNAVALNLFTELAGSLQNFFAGEVEVEGDVVVLMDTDYTYVDQFNEAVYAVNPNFVKVGATIELETLEQEGYEFEGYLDGTTLYESTYTVTNESAILVPDFKEAIPTYVITKTNATTPGYYVDYRESYTFVDAEDNGVFVSNNKGKGSTTAYMDVFFTDNGTFTFTYKVSSESGWDKFRIYAQANGEAYAQYGKDISGEQTATVTFTVEPGDKIYFQYTKDSGGNKGDDTVTISNMTFVTDTFYTKAELSFETNGGNEIETLEVYTNAKVDQPADPVKEGYFFDGWYADADLTNKFDFATGIAADATIYAKWLKGVKVIYANTGDTAVETEVVKPGAAIAQPSVTPVKNDQYFNGWYADEECTTAFDFAAGVAEDTVVYAGWRNPIKVAFNSNGGSAIEDIYTDVNVAITLPAEPVKEGYVFAGWYKEQELYSKFTGESGVTESTTVYAKWLKELTITYKYGNEVVGTDDAVEDDVYSAATPKDFVALVIGWYTDSELTNEFAKNTVLKDDVTLYAKVANFAPVGVLSAIVNGDSSSYGWTFDAAKDTFTSSNKGVGNSMAILELTFAKESFTAFSYVVNSESNYDFLQILVNGTSVYSSKVSGKNAQDITGAFSYTFKTGDVLKIQYSKDSSGNQGSDCAVLSNFVINDGVPAATVTFNYQDEAVENVVVDAELNALISGIEGFASYAPADTADRKFGGWYYDAECTKPLGDKDAVTSSVVLYAKYLYPVTVSFWIDETETELEPIQVWTGISIASFMPENPTLQGYIFRYWLDEDAEEFDPTKGVTEDIMLVAYFEELPAGATKDVAVEIEIQNGQFISNNAETNEEFQNYYFVLTPETTDYYYFKFSQDYVTINGGTISATSKGYRRYQIVDSEDNTVLSQTSSDSKVLLQAGVTYYVSYNLAYSTYQAWGTFKAEVYCYDNDSALEAIQYEFGTQVNTAPAVFKSSTHTIVYKYECETSGTYALKVASAAWAKATVYSDADLSKQVTYNQVYNKNNVVDLVVEAGKTYYIVLSQNWSGSSLTTNVMSFSLMEYPQGYDANNPFDYTLGEVINAEFASGNNAYYAVTVTEAGTYKLSILSLADTNSKTIDLYKASDLTTKVATLAGSAAADFYIENLEAGDYVIKVYNTSASYNASFTASLTKVATGLYWTTAEELTLNAEMELNAAGTYYYEFTTGADTLWYFINVTGGTVKVYTAAKAEVGSTAIQLTAATTYYLVVTSEEETVAVTYTTLVEYADGKSPSGAFTYNEETMNLNIEKANYTTYFKFTPTESGKYRFYTKNAASGNIDTKGWLYDDTAFSSQLKTDDDSGKNHLNDGLCGYRYDFYFEYELVAGVEYYVKVTYNTDYNSADSLSLHIELVA